MSDIVTKPKAKQRPKVARPRLYKVILLNDDFYRRARSMTHEPIPAIRLTGCAMSGR